MPELPEVQAVVDTLSPVLTGVRITTVQLNRQDILSEHRFTRPPRNPKPGAKAPTLNLPNLLQGRTIQSITRRAKRILFTLDNQTAFYIHLGMSGRITLAKPNEAPPKHTHLLLHFTKAPGTGTSSARSTQHSALHFTDPRRFGKIVYLPTLPPEGTEDPDLGPEPLTLTPKQLHTALAKANRPLKPALLDQSLIAGLGNIYVDESLHAAKLHPLRKANTLTLQETTTLLRHIKSILKKAIAAKGSTLRDYRDANGNPGAFQSLHKVYDRKGEPCPRCKHPIERIIVGGRSTHLCPNCQKK